MKEKEGSRMTPKTFYYCYLFLSLLGLNYTYSEQELSPIYCGKNSDYSFLSHMYLCYLKFFYLGDVLLLFQRCIVPLEFQITMHNTPGKTNSF